MCGWPRTCREKNVNSALFLCLHYSYHHLPRESFWPLVHWHLGRVGSIKTRVAAKPASVSFPWGGISKAEEYAQSAPSLPDHAPGALEFPSRAVWVPSPGLSPRVDCVTKGHTPQPQRGQEGGTELGHTGWPVQTRVHRAPPGRMELCAEWHSS